MTPEQERLRNIDEVKRKQAILMARPGWTRSERFKLWAVSQGVKLFMLLHKLLTRTGR